MDYQRWNEQLEQDIADGKLETFAQEAIAEFKAGNSLYNSTLLAMLSD